ncbi:hypothetical protein GCM10009836_25420 [Pseudonocardia ailaonensis]|uniref:SsuA/THI5-like domain-containing protein n=1 Tax=Pseudonocardia ailaonensis TaxID=367279 RepID=A0ABN2MZG5_9PSEU
MKKLQAILGAALVGALTVACSSGAAQDTGGAAGGQHRVVIATQGSDVDIIAKIAAEHGMFAAHGIVPDLVPVGGAGPAAAGLASGSINVMTQSPAFAVQSGQTGSKLKLFCGVLNTIALAVMARPDSSFARARTSDWRTEVSAWEGATIGVPTLGGALQIWLELVADAAGLDKKKITFVAVGLGAAATSALDTKKVDLVATSPFVQQIMASQNYPVVFDFSTDGVAAIGQQAQGGYLATESWLAANPDAAKAFCAAAGDSMKYLADPANKEPITAMLKSSFGVPDAAIPEALTVVSTHYSTDLSCGPIEKALAAAVTGGVLKSAPTCAELVWNGQN